MSDCEHKFQLLGDGVCDNCGYSMGYLFANSEARIAELNEQLLSAKTLAGVFEAENQRLRDEVARLRRLYVDWKTD